MEHGIERVIKVLVEMYSAEQLAEKYLEERELNKGIYESMAKLKTQNEILKQVIILNGIKTCEEMVEE